VKNKKHFSAIGFEPGLLLRISVRYGPRISVQGKHNTPVVPNCQSQCRSIFTVIGCLMRINRKRAWAAHSTETRNDTETRGI